MFADVVTPSRLLSWLFLGIWSAALGLRAGTLLDTSFQLDPRVRMSFSAMAVQPDGRILLAGASTPSGPFLLARLLPDGALDTGFGGGGWSGLQGQGNPRYSYIRGITLLSNGSILVVIQNYNPFSSGSSSVVTRVSRDGSSAVVWTTFFDSFQLAERPDGKIYGWGSHSWTYSTGGFRIPAIQLFDAEGRPDSGFTFPQELVPTQIPSGSVSSVRVCRDGDLVVGLEWSGAVLARLSPSGQIRWRIDQWPGGTDTSLTVAEHIAEDNQGAILALPRSSQGAGAFRLSADGVLDDTGFRSPLIGGWKRSLQLRDGRLLISGEFGTIGGLSRWVVACLMDDGSLDLRFAPGLGPTWRSQIVGLGEQPDGKILIAGEFTEFDGQPVRGLVRLHPRNPESTGPTNAFYGPDFLMGYECGQPIRLTLTRAGDLDGTQTLRVSTKAGTARAGDDFIPFATNLVFGPGTRFGDVEVPVVSDDLAEGDESFSLEFQPGNATTPFTSINPLPVRLMNSICYVQFATNRIVLREMGSEQRITGTDTYIAIQSSGSFEFTVRRIEESAREGRDYYTYGGPPPRIPIYVGQIDNAIAEGDRTFRFEIQAQGNGIRLPGPTNLVVVIEDDDTAAGPARGFSRAPGVSSDLRTVARVVGHPGGGWIANGAFRTADGLERSGIARLKPDGLVDDQFVPPDLPAGTITCAAVQIDGKVLVGGLFPASLDPTGSGLVRLLSNGSVDPEFPRVSAATIGHSQSIVAIEADSIGRRFVHRVLSDGSELTTLESPTGQLLDNWTRPAGFGGTHLQSEPEGTLLVRARTGVYRFSARRSVQPILSTPEFWAPWPDWTPVASSLNGETWISDGQGIGRYSRTGSKMGSITNAAFAGRSFPILGATGLMRMGTNRMFALAVSTTNILSVVFESDGQLVGLHVHEGLYLSEVTHLVLPAQHPNGEIAVLTASSSTLAQRGWLQLSNTGVPVSDIAIHRMARSAEGQISLSFRGQAPNGVEVLSSDQLGSWSPWLHLEEVNTGMTHVIPIPDHNDSQRFFRANSKQR